MLMINFNIKYWKFNIIDQVLEHIVILNCLKINTCFYLAKYYEFKLHLKLFLWASNIYQSDW